MFRLFDDIDDPSSRNSVGRTRNDAVVSSAEYRRRLAKFASYIVEFVESPEILAIQEVEKLGVLQDLAEAINMLDTSVFYAASFRP